MKLHDSERDLGFVMMTDTPLRQRASDSWQQAWRAGNIPESLFQFYVKADYFSPDKAPPFLADPDRILFSYLATVAECIRENLCESQELVDEVKNIEKNIYNHT